MITLHADPASSGGDGTTSALSGANAAYAGLGAAIAALEASGPDARGDAVTVLCHNATGIADTDSGVLLDQFDVATTAARYLQIEGAVALSGVFDHSLWYLEVTNRSAIYNNVTNHLRLKNLQIRLISNDGNGHIALKTLNLNQGTNPEHVVENVILECTGTNKNGAIGVGNKDRTLGTGFSRNYNIVAYGFVTGFGIENVVGEIFENCGAYDNQFGWVGGGSNGILRNCAAHHNTDGNYVTAFEASSTNNSGDTGDDPPGSGDSTGTPAFVRRGQRNYIPTAGDTVLKNTGTTPTYATTDLRGFTRSSADIGPFEAVTGTAALTGTATASIAEADIVAGGKTAIATLSNDSWIVEKAYPEFGFASTKGVLAADSAGGGGGRTGNGDMTVTFPSGFTPAAGFFAVLWVYNDQGDASTPTDWAEIAGSPFGAGTEKMCVFTKTLVGGESSPVTTISGSGTNVSHCANMLIFFNGQLGAIGTPSNGTGTPMTAGAITTTDARSFVVGLCGRGDNEAASGQTFGGSATGVVEGADGGTGAGNDSECSAYHKRIDNTATSSGNGSATTSATDPWVSVLIEIKAATPYADARAAMATGFDSAQAEGTGFDALRSTILPVTALARTSSLVTTATLVAAASYNITAQETVTDTIPASAVNGGAAIVASPTFTIAAEGGVAFMPAPMKSVQQAVGRAAYW